MSSSVARPQQNNGPLAGFRVLDLTSILVGPMASQLLGDLGADVIKVEPPGGDGVREVGPRPTNGRGAVFLAVNRNKRSLVLDLKHPEGLAALREMVSQADVFLHNMRPQAIDRLGLDYAHLSQLRPELVYCGAYGFRRGGPYSHKPAYDDIIQAASGLADLQGLEAVPDGHTPSTSPRYITSSVADKITGWTVAGAIGFALLHRCRTGQGQAVEVTMFEAMAAFNSVEHLYGHSYEPRRGNAGYPRTLSPHRRPYRTRDGYISALPYSDTQWASLFELAGRDDLAADRRFASMSHRLENIGTLYAVLGDILLERSTEQWLNDLDAVNIPAMAVASIGGLADDPHLAKVDFWRLADDPELGRLRFPSMPFTLASGGGDIRHLPPRLGEHSVEVLREFGFTEADIEQLLASGACRDASAVVSGSVVSG